MNKQDLVNVVARETGLTLKGATFALNAVLDGIKDGVMRDGVVALTGFGSFNKKARSARDVKSPRTGEIIHVSAKNVVSFKAGKDFKAAVNS